MAKVYLAVGHGHRDGGKFDPGAVSADGRWHEQDAGDVIVAEAARLLRARGATVKDEAFQDDPNFPGTARDANRWGADIMVSVHHDWSGAPEGAFGHWYTDAGKAIGDAVQRQVGRAGFPLRNTWHKRRTDLTVLKATNMPALLYEVGRIGQPDLRTEPDLKRMGAAVAGGIADHLNLGRPAGPVAKPRPAGPFPDVPGDHTHADGIAAVAAAGLMGGYADGTFRPDVPPTRGQLATVLARLL